MSQYAITERTRVKRGNKRATYDKQAIHQIIDEAMVCHVACNHEGVARVQPTLHWRDNERLYIHGSSKNGLFQALLAGNTASIAITLLDGIVFARSAFAHSVNYRSIIIYSRAQLVENEQEKRHALDLMLEKFHTGRSKEARPPNETEMKATSVLAFDMEEVSAKVRTGGPNDDPADLTLEVWAGVQPIKTVLDEIVYETD
ncbi:MAG: pyridoxamine 5'-phosphate oxidase family protein [Gammaproteobacteria bacterium]|nr:pyridoxamine 5'-phosphate oxidase family protein [Gammaproteobacteria bacterium]